ncbi:MAG: hypothetical protein RBU45_02585 [Myxococcota bacterium]|nr:hypothetical protein [Myxococcota bacterium]
MSRPLASVRRPPAVGRGVLLLLALLLAGGCAKATRESGAPEGPDLGEVTAPFLEFSVDPGETGVGAEVWLSWRTAGIDELTLTTELEGKLGRLPLQGSRAVVAARSQTYSLEGRGPGGRVRIDRRLTVHAPPVLQLQVQPERVRPGDPVTVRWTSEGAQLLVLTGEGLPATVVPPQGERRLVVRQPLLLQLDGEGIGGHTVVTRLLEVFLPPRIHSFSASPPVVAAGQGSTLAWVTDEAEQRALRCEGLGLEEERLPRTGSRQVTPTGPTLCRLLVQGPGGAAEARLLLDVLPPPTVQLFTATPEVTSAVTGAHLTWDVLAAAEVRLAEEPWAPFPVTFPPRGALDVLPPATTTYSLTARGPGGEVRQEVVVTIPPPPEILVWQAEPSRVAPGASVRLTWQVTGAEALRLYANGLEVDGLSPPQGSSDIPVTAPTRFDLLALGLGGEDLATVEVGVIDPPEIYEFSLLPARLAPGDETVLRWRVEEGATVQLFAGERPLTPGPLPSTGEFRWRPAETTRFLLQAQGVGGLAQAEQEVIVVPPPAILAFSAVPAAVVPGGWVTLSWEVERAAELLLWEEGAPGVQLLRTAELVGELAVTPVRTTRYRLVAVGELQAVEQSLEVLVGPPGPVRLLQFGLDPPFALAGEPVLATWQTSGTYRVLLRGPDGVLLAQVDGPGAEDGSVVFEPGPGGRFTLELLGVEGSLTGEASVEVGPVGPLLSEVYYDHFGSDEAWEWVELYNPGALPLSLVGLTLGYGGADYTYGTARLSGEIPPSGCIVIGGPSSEERNGAPVYDLLHDFEPDLQNGGSPADGIALFDPRDPLADLPLDAVIYGEANDSQLLDETGEPGEVDLAESGQGRSAARLGLFPTIWQNGDPTPGRCFPLQLRLLTPEAGAATGGEELTVEVAGLVPPCVLHLGEQALSCQRTGWNRLRCVSPGLPPGTHDLVLTNGDGEQAVLPGAFTAR